MICIYKNPNPELEKALEDNDGYCPCAVVKDEDTKCMCKSFREMKTGTCMCGLYTKENSKYPLDDPNESGNQDLQRRNEMDIDRIFELLKSDSYKDRSKGEYWLVKGKYENLHRIIIKREAGKLDFTPYCSMEQWKAQAAAMGQYLYQLEVKAEIEGVNLYDED